MARVNINRTHSRAYARDWADQKVGPLARRILIQAKVMAPVETGALRFSLTANKSESTFEVRYKVGSRVRHAYLIQAGARPHGIRPRNPNGFLIFYWKKVNRRVKLRSVNHPGFQAVPYLQRPLVEQGTAARFKVIIYPAMR